MGDGDERRKRVKVKHSLISLKRRVNVEIRVMINYRMSGDAGLSKIQDIK